MYKRIETQRKKAGISMELLAKELNLSGEDLQKKLEGKIPFTLDEAWKVKEILSYGGSLEELFYFFE